MINKGKTHCHDDSLLILNTMFLSFLSTLNGCYDASEIKILVKIKKKKSTFSILNNLYAVLNLFRLMANVHVYGSAIKHTLYLLFFFSSAILPSIEQTIDRAQSPLS